MNHKMKLQTAERDTETLLNICLYGDHQERTGGGCRGRGREVRGGVRTTLTPTCILVVKT